MKELIKQLAEVWGPSGYEHRVRATLQAMVAPYVEASYVDGLGNLIVRVGNGGKKILFAAHMDQIGMMITYREPSGFLRFSPIGGLLRPTLVGQRAVFEHGTVGTIGVHDQWGTARTHLPDLDGFFIDVSDGQGGDFQHGQPAVIESRVISRGSRIVGGALDDRVGCAVLVKALHDLNKQCANTVYMAFTVQEEVGERGAAPATFGVQPDVAIAVDVTPTGRRTQEPQATRSIGGRHSYQDSRSRVVGFPCCAGVDGCHRRATRNPLSARGLAHGAHRCHPNAVGGQGDSHWGGFHPLPLRAHPVRNGGRARLLPNSSTHHRLGERPHP
ncbi:MAG UNVERIFIED_CONTAM: hypothetical protein LVT10_18565 [Anaerolineae bacterium]